LIYSLINKSIQFFLEEKQNVTITYSNMAKSKRHLGKSRKNKSRKVKGGASPKESTIRKTNTTLQEYRDGARPINTPGFLSSSLPPAILAAKKAIQYANEHPGNDLARRDAEAKIELADYLTTTAHARTNWKHEKNIQPNPKARDWYEPGNIIKWQLE
jgi:hypothetical protein